MSASYLKDLNPEQLRAVQHHDGPLLIFAGAGSGKTRVLTRRIAHLVLEHGVDPSHILAVTFTNKAAKEMKERVYSLFQRGMFPLWVSTFHSSCVRILRHHAKYLEYTSNFAIYDTSDSVSALKRVFKRLNVDVKHVEPRRILSYIDRAKNEYKFPDDLRSDPTFGIEFSELAADLYAGYQEELRQSNAMDFGDLLCNVVTLFKLEPRLLEQYQNRFRYLLVDEYQDTNQVQYLLIKLLTQKHHNICVVGDDDQSIYAFRGATIENILNFKNDFPEATTITLGLNYRSSQNILSAASAVISRNERRQEKIIRTENPQGSPIACFKAFDEKDEGEFVTREITTLCNQGFRPADIAIFYRTNAQSRAIEEALCEAGLPYQIFGGHKFYDRKEIKDILAYLRLLLNPNDNEAFLRVINTPIRGLGAAAVGGLAAFARNHELSLLPGLEKLLASDPCPLPAAQKSRFARFIDLISHLKSNYETTVELLLAPPGSTDMVDSQNAIALLLRDIAEKSGYLEQLKAQDSLEAENRIENLNELFRVAVDFAERSLEQGVFPSLSDFLDRASLSSDLEQENTASSSGSAEVQKFEGKVSLMTLHLAKGLEFDVVFLVGLEEGLLPHVRSIDDRQALEEERRLCYVGITRAKKRLFLSRATDRQSFGRNNWYTGVASRFIDDLPDSVLDDRKSGFHKRSSVVYDYTATRIIH